MTFQIISPRGRASPATRLLESSNPVDPIFPIDAAGAMRYIRGKRAGSDLGGSLSAPIHGCRRRGEVGRVGSVRMDVKLVVFLEDGTRRDFPIAAGANTIGRKDDCTIRVRLPMVSRRHAEVFLDNDTLVLRDLGAANGTFLNNRRITEDKLGAGDQVVIGPVVFTVQVDGKPSDEEIIKIQSKVPVGQANQQSGSRVGTSKHVYMSNEEVDPISALEALASSADQTAIGPEDEE